MARRSNLAATVARARPARAGTGVGRARVVGPAVGPGHPVVGRGQNQWHPKGETKTTDFARGLTTTAPPPVLGAPAAKPTGMPWDSQAEEEWGDGERRYNDKISGLSGAWKSREEWYGLGETNNPYSQASLLQHRHEVDQRQVVNTAGLGLYSGSTVNHHASADRSFSIDGEALKKAFDAEKFRFDNEKDETLHEWEGEQGQIKRGAIDRLAETEPAPAPEEGGGAGAQPGLGGDQGHPAAFKAGVGAGKSKPKAPPGYHAYKGPGNQWWFAPNS